MLSIIENEQNNFKKLVFMVVPLILNWSRFKNYMLDSQQLEKNKCVGINGWDTEVEWDI